MTEYKPLPTTDEKDLEKVYYQDSYLKISSKGITIYRYYFLTEGSSKTIPWDHLLGYDTDATLGLTSLDFKGWGMGTSPIWWAYGPGGGRGPLCQIEGVSKPQLILTTGSWIKKGTSVENLTAAREAIKHGWWASKQDPADLVAPEPPQMEYKPLAAAK